MIDSFWKAFSNEYGFENIVYIMFLCFHCIAFITIKRWMDATTYFGKYMFFLQV